MSERGSAEAYPHELLVDADVLFSYLVGDHLTNNAERLLTRAEEGAVRISVASEIFDDVVTALRSGGISIQTVVELVGDLRRIPHAVLPTTVDIVLEAMALYTTYGGPRKLHYFDSFHVATAKTHDLSMVTSDRFVLANSPRMGIRALDLRDF